MDIVHHEPAGAPFPDGVQRWITRSAVDGAADRALAWPGRLPVWVVVIHGHGSHEDQLYTRPDIRDCWLPALRGAGAGILTPDLRGNAWMSPAAAADLHGLLECVRARFGARRFVFFSGSMGGSSNLYYALQHPEDVTALAALGAAPDPAPYVRWCRGFADGSIQRQIGEAIESAYGSGPEQDGGAYADRCAPARGQRLSMPVWFSHGERDVLMPVSEARRLAEALRHAPDFHYREIPGGNHDSPLFQAVAIRWIEAMIRLAGRNF